MVGAFRVCTARWPDDAQILHDIRHDVFVREQSVPQEIEWDGRDGECLHAIALSNSGEAIGCGRLLPDGHIGRLAVRASWRGQGVGAAMLQHLVGLARAAGHDRVVLNAQTHAAGFYRRYGFVPVGDEFMEAGIAHQAMERLMPRD